VLRIFCDLVHDATIILDAAGELFLEQGYAGFSMRRVAERIGYSANAKNAMVAERIGYSANAKNAMAAQSLHFSWPSRYLLRNMDATAWISPTLSSLSPSVRNKGGS